MQENPINLDVHPLIDQLSGLRAGQKRLSHLEEAGRRSLLQKIAYSLLAGQDGILAANAKDLESAKAAGLSAALMDRLVLSKDRLKSLSQAVLAISEMAPVLNQTLHQATRPDGLTIRRVTVPLGVIFFIFESRPNVLVDAVALALKSGNGMLLKGGREAEGTNQALMACLRRDLIDYGVEGAFAVLQAADRNLVGQVLGCSQWIDLVIPRGGAELVNYVRSHTQIPVIAHDKGLCHLYVHSDAPKDQVIPLVLNSKVARPGVCNALETLLIHKDWPHRGQLLKELLQHQVELRLDQKLFTEVREGSLKDYLKDFSLNTGKIFVATPEDWNTEYLALVLNVGEVTGVDEAISHIATYGSHHTEVICAVDPVVIEQFTIGVDASCVGVNASTRFNDGGELGLGAEIGISTSKLHAYGPMGAAQLVTSRFEVYGAGHIRK